MKTQSSTRTSWDRTALGLSFAVGLLAFVVLVGWHAHLRAAIQIFHGLVPMQYNTALCFLALGVAGVGLLTRRRLLLLAGGSFAALMGLLVILEYVTGISFGIDTLFFYPWDSTLTATPGRMALTTAISFFLTGGTLIILAVRQDAYSIFGIINSVPLSLALTSLIGYSFQITYVLPFDLGAQMALHTALAFLAHGIAMLGYAWKYAERGPEGLPKWTAGIGVAFLPVLLVVASALFAKQSWRIVPFEALISIIGVGLITLAVLKLNKAKVAYKGLLMIASPLILLLGFVGFVVYVKQQSQSAQAWALHSKEVVSVSRSLLGRLAEAESAARGNFITGDERFLNSYARSAESVAQTTTHLRNLVSDNPAQEARLGKIESLTAQRMDYLRRNIGFVKEGRKDQAKEIIRGMKGTDLMDQVHAEMRTFLQEEDRLGAERRQILDGLWQRLSWLLVAGTSAAILLASVLILLFSGGISRRLQQLRDNALSLAAGHELAAPLEGHDEIAELDQVFHEMAVSLDEVTRREKAVIDGTTDAIFVKNLEHRYLMMNQAGADAIGLTLDKVIGASNEELIEADSARRIREQDNEVLATGQTITHEFISTNKAGVTRNYLATRGPYRDQHGNIVGTLGISRDITERKLMEVELERARDAALESVRLKSEFLANMSHEIRTPMNGVIGMTGLLLETGLSSQQQEYTENIQSSADALLIIINDILDFSKIEAGLLRFEKIDFDLRASVEGPVELLAEQAQAKGLELASIVYEDVPTALQGDPGRLRQVLMNLIGNAVKFTGQGEIVVSVTKFSETAEHAMLRFEIRDTGIGISAEAQRRLFHAFTQADGSTTRKYGGTGLGLAICKQLVELMGGEIGIESAPGIGSTFWFTGKFEKQSATAKTAGAAAGSLSGARALIVDDNVMNRGILNQQTGSWGMIPTKADVRQRHEAVLNVRIIIAEDNVMNQKVALGQLYNLGYRAQVVPNGRELLKALENAEFDLILMDCQMPEMDGFAATAEIRRREGAARHTIIIAMTASALEGDAEKCLAAGMDDYLSKPVKADALRQKLERWIKPAEIPLLSEGSGSERSREAPLPANHTRDNVIDYSQLASLRALQQPGKADFVTELIDLFFNDMASQRKVLHKAVADNDATEIRRVAHFLMGISANIGARQMVPLYAKLEGPDSANGNAVALLKRIDREFELVREALQGERQEGAD